MNVSPLNTFPDAFIVLRYVEISEMEYLSPGTEVGAATRAVHARILNMPKQMQSPVPAAHRVDDDGLCGRRLTHLLWLECFVSEILVLHW